MQIAIPLLTRTTRLPPAAVNTSAVPSHRTRRQSLGTTNKENVSNFTALFIRKDIACIGSVVSCAVVRFLEAIPSLANTSSRSSLYHREITPPNYLIPNNAPPPPPRPGLLSPHQRSNHHFARNNMQRPRRALFEELRERDVRRDA